ncbi:hypothetical protein R5N98_02850 [Tenacibaculum maritimum]|uniref:hypothetical protein n=1 Tax=Tenacibaculum maritimum TaxID=107401 RepID=UPI0012E66FFC|nr:hypothetical protein [Tenacibaculum maritimum]CAA0253492.1 hypothetical protein DPIF8902391_90050 [Tenacibaculum maritimum]
MEKLIEQLQRNSHALNRLKERYYDAQMSTYWTFFQTEDKRNIELKWILKIQKRVLKMRYRILEKINSEITKEMHNTSAQSRELNLQVA